MKPIPIYYIVLVIFTFLAACAPDLKSRTDYAIETAKSNFPNLGIVNTSDYELVRKLEIKTPNATIQLLQPRQSHGEGQIIVFSNPQNQSYAVPLPPNRYKGYWNFVYDTEPRPKTLKINTFEIQLNKALDTLGLNTGYHGLHVFVHLCTTGPANLPA
jgi:hypothetical protein